MPGKRSFTIREKLEVLDRINRGNISNRKLAKELGIAETNIRKWRKDEDVLRKAINKDNIRFTETIGGKRSLQKEILMQWYRQECTRNRLPTRKEFRKEAQRIYFQLHKTSSPEKPNFDWLSGYIKRHRLRFRKSIKLLDGFVDDSEEDTDIESFVNEIASETGCITVKAEITKKSAAAKIGKNAASNTNCDVSAIDDIKASDVFYSDSEEDDDIEIKIDDDVLNEIVESVENAERSGIDWTGVRKSDGTDDCFQEIASPNSNDNFIEVVERTHTNSVQTYVSSKEQNNNDEPNEIPDKGLHANVIDLPDKSCVIYENGNDHAIQIDYLNLSETGDKSCVIYENGNDHAIPIDYLNLSETCDVENLSNKKTDHPSGPQKDKHSVKVQKRKSPETSKPKIKDRKRKRKSSETEETTGLDDESFSNRTMNILKDEIEQSFSQMIKSSESRIKEYIDSKFKALENTLSQLQEHLLQNAKIKQEQYSLFD